jgi:hypothetical protein
MKRLHNFRQAFSSKEEFKAFVKTKEAPAEGTAYFNEDLLPTPPCKSNSMLKSHLLIACSTAEMEDDALLRVLPDNDFLAK